MELVNKFRILIIDDNPNIHSDFIKILTLNKNNKELEDLEAQLFEDTSTSTNTSNSSSGEVDSGFPIFEIDCATQGQEGAEKIRLALEEGRPYALAFVDIRMPPGWDGVETVKHIWKIDKEIQIVICTAYSDYTWEDTVKQLGMGDNLLILKKPFDNTAVRQLASALTRKWMLSQESRAYTQDLEKKVEERTIMLQESLSEIHAFLESSADGILIVASDGTIKDYNSKFAKMWDIPNKILEAKDFEKLKEWLTNKVDEKSKLITDINFSKDKPAQIMNEEVALRGGQIFEYYSQPNEFKEKIVGRIWSFRDITQRAYLERKLQYQATHDNLTDLPNRLLLIDRIKSAITRAKNKHDMFAVMFIDLDKFKRVNDSLNHAAGDELLNKVAKRITDEIRSSDTLARLGGDEFVLIMPDIKTENTVVEIIVKLLEKVAQEFVVAERSLYITASIGVSMFPKDGETSEEMLRNADLAMYIAKRDGGNRFQFYEKELNEESLRRLEKEIELRRALQRDELVLHYQPQIDTVTGKIVAVEALVRWNHPAQGLISPIEFLPIAEDSNLILDLGYWILHTACKQNKAWQDAGLSKIKVAVNLSKKQINDAGFLNVLDTVLSSTGLAPEYLVLEIVEETIINNPKVIQVINEIANRGIQIAFQDFGAGNSTLNHLRVMPLNQIKIDQTFIKNINNKKVDEVIIEAILSMAKNLKLDVVAEGVETQEQLDFLNKINCHEIQGYFFSKPLTPAGVEEVIKGGIRGSAAAGDVTKTA